MIIFAAAVAASAAISFFVLPPVFEASTSIMVQDQGGEGTPAWSLDTYLNILNGVALRRAIIDDLKLDISEEELKASASATLIKDTNILRLSVKRESAEEASKIANAWARLFVTRVNALKLHDLSGAIRLKEAALDTATAEISKQKPTIELKRALVDEPLAYEAAKSATGRGIHGLSSIQIKSEEPNPVYQDLLSRINNYRLELHDMQARADLLKADSQMFVRVLSVARPPEKPVAPRKLLNIAVAGMLGLMIGIFLAFAMEALETGAKRHATAQ